jgi:hypothetical protein
VASVAILARRERLFTVVAHEAELLAPVVGTRDLRAAAHVEQRHVAVGAMWLGVGGMHFTGEGHLALAIAIELQCKARRDCPGGTGQPGRRMTTPTRIRRASLARFLALQPPHARVVAIASAGITTITTASTTSTQVGR